MCHDDNIVLSGTFTTANPNTSGNKSIVSFPPSNKDNDRWLCVTSFPASAVVQSITIDSFVSVDGEEFERQARGGITV